MNAAPCSSGFAVEGKIFWSGSRSQAGRMETMDNRLPLSLSARGCKKAMIAPPKKASLLLRVYTSSERTGTAFIGMNQDHHDSVCGYVVCVPPHLQPKVVPHIEGQTRAR